MASGNPSYADPVDSVGYLTRITFRAFTKALEARILPQGVSSGQWPFLRALWREDGLTQVALSRRVGMREPSAVVALHSLQKAGLVVRRKSLKDRRKMQVFLTPAARALESPLLQEAAEVNRMALEGLSPEQVALLRDALLLINRNLTR
jgi:DNA-binding MarR family transcriptional regulator